MKRKTNISLLLPAIALLFFASNSQAQVSATARVTLTVIPAPGINFSPANPAKPSTIVNRSNDGGLTLRTSSNVAVVLKSSTSRTTLNTENVGQGTTKTLTTKDLNGVSSVEVLYLGS